jgi:hypothetical protein
MIVWLILAITWSILAVQALINYELYKRVQKLEDEMARS